MKKWKMKQLVAVILAGMLTVGALAMPVLGVETGGGSEMTAVEAVEETAEETVVETGVSDTEDVSIEENNVDETIVSDESVESEEAYDLEDTEESEEEDSEDVEKFEQPEDSSVAVDSESEVDEESNPELDTYADSEATESAETDDQESNPEEINENDEASSIEETTEQEHAEVNDGKGEAEDIEEETVAQPAADSEVSDRSDSEETGTTVEDNEKESITTDAVLGVVESGTCGADGNNLNWTLDEKGILTISGTGRMKEYYNHYSSIFNNYTVKTVIIEEGVTSIGSYAFYSCTDLTFVIIPDSVVSIGDDSFRSCTSLTSVNTAIGALIPNSVTFIGSEAFESCSSLTSVSIPNSVTSIGYGVFEGCTALESVTISNNVTSILKDTFRSCSSLTSMNMPNGVMIPDSVTRIEDEAFSGCSNITNVIIPNTVTYIGKKAFQFCDGLTCIAIPNSVTSIGDYAFASCSSLKGMIIGNGVKNIGYRGLVGNTIIYSASEEVIGFCNSHYITCNRPSQYCPEIGAENVDYTLPIKLTFNVNIKGKGGYAYLYESDSDTCVESIFLDEQNIPGYDKILNLDFSNIEVGKSYYITIDEGAFDWYAEKDDEIIVPFIGIDKNEWKFSTVDFDYLPFTNPNLKIANSGKGDEISLELFKKVFKEEKIAKKYYNKEAYRLPSGICFGMSYVAAAKKKGNTFANQYGKLSSFSTNSYNNKPSGQDYSLLDIIKMAHIYQFTSSLVNEKNKTTKDKYDDIINKIKNNEQIIIHIWEYHFLGTDASHALVPITITENTSTDIKVLVYDCSGVFNTDANRKTFINTLTFKKSGSKIIGFEYNDDSGINYEHIGINTIDDSLDKLIEGDENSDDIAKFYTENPLVIARKQIESTALNQVISSFGENTENEDGYFYWADGPSFENILASDNTISITNGPDEIEIKANEGASIKLDIENKEAKVENTDASANDYSITYLFYDDNDNTKSIVITGETSSTVNTESTDNGISVSNEDNTPIDAVISILDNGEEVNTVDVTATTNTVYVTCDDNNQIEVLEDRDSDGTYETVVATTDGKPIGNAEITGIVDKQYTGSAIEQIISVTYSGTELNEGTDYTVAYENNINAGTASVIITGIGDYTGTIKKTFTITPAPISNAAITGIKNKTYTGKAITQTPTVKVGDTTLQKDTDYTLSYANNKNAGTATVTITGIGNYTGTVTKTFTIAKAAQTITVETSASKIAVGKTATVTITGAKGKKSFTSSNTAVATVTKATGKVTAKKVGKVTITATAAATTNYKSASKKVSIYVVPAATKSITAANQATGIKLTWKKVTGAKGYKVYRGSTLLKTITSGSMVTYTDKKANTNGKKYTFKVYATAATGTGPVKSVVAYRVARPVISSVGNTSAGKMTVKWGKDAKATGYYVQYSTSKSFTTGNKAVSITKNSTVSKAFSGLTKGKTYYVRIRTYKTVDGVKIWSAWSVAKAVKISK